MSIAIQVENLGKQYRIGQKQAEYQTLRETLSGAVTAPFRRARRLLQGEAYGAAELTETIWALKDVSFEVKHGEAIGIIGANGAGKSTLLKILSRITEPTTGIVKLRGRVGSLLEVGTGFHQELTGRENIYLNGAILGMRRHEIQRKFDEIVNFAGVEQFIDTPVKHFSSGMRLRLGFAVAAHLEPEILVVDEVLAVGDAEFQRKCLGKMSDVASEGRTVLFVSHNMAAVSALCQQGILLESGEIKYSGTADETINCYLSRIKSQIELSLDKRIDRKGNGKVRFVDVKVTGGDSLEQTSAITTGRPVSFFLSYKVHTPVDNAFFQLILLDIYNNRLFTCHMKQSDTPIPYLSTSGTIKCYIPQLPLAPGYYRATIACKEKQGFTDFIENAFEITVSEGDFFGTGKIPVSQKHGPFLVQHSWELME